MPAHDSFDEQNCFPRIAEGDEQAFSEAMHFYSPRLLSFVFNLTRTRHAAEDIVQETFLRLWLKREHIAADNLGGWLHRVASNLTYTYLRREAMQGKMLHSFQKKTVATDGEIEKIIDYREQEQMIGKALAQLPEQQRMVYKLSREESMSREEIAELLQIAPNTVKNHLAKATHSIKAFLKNAGGMLFSWLL